MQASRLLTASGGACLRRPQGSPLLSARRPRADALRRSCAAAPAPLRLTAAAASAGSDGARADPAPELQPRRRGRSRDVRVASSSRGGSARARAAPDGPGGASSGSTGRRRGRPRKGQQAPDPHSLTNVDADSMRSDPGDLGRVAEGVLEKYEHLEKLHAPHPASPSAGSPAAAASHSAGEGGKAGERGQPSDFERMEALARGQAGMGEGEGAATRAGGEELSTDEMHCPDPDAQGPCCSIDQGDRAGEGGASAMLATDSPGAPQAQHPGQVGEAAMAPEGAGQAGEGAGVQDVE